PPLLQKSWYTLGYKVVSDYLTPRALVNVSVAGGVQVELGYGASTVLYAPTRDLILLDTLTRAPVESTWNLTCAGSSVPSTAGSPLYFNLTAYAVRLDLPAPLAPVVLSLYNGSATLRMLVSPARPPVALSYGGYEQQLYAYAYRGYNVTLVNTYNASLQALLVRLRQSDGVLAYDMSSSPVLSLVLSPGLNSLQLPAWLERGFYALVVKPVDEAAPGVVSGLVVLYVI
ncbi:MAG: hypothetical protein ACP5HP_03580, partial [Thermogladius sp.]